jgi:hypothetical protein
MHVISDEFYRIKYKIVTTKNRLVAICHSLSLFFLCAFVIDTYIRSLH